MRRSFLAVRSEGTLSRFSHICWMVLTEMSAKPGTSPSALLQFSRDGEECSSTASHLSQKFVFCGLPEPFFAACRSPFLLATESQLREVLIWILMIFRIEFAFCPSLSAIYFGVTPSSNHTLTLLFSTSPNYYALSMVARKTAPALSTLELDRRLSFFQNQLIRTVNSMIEQCWKKSIEKQLLKVIWVTNKLDPKDCTFFIFYTVWKSSV